MVGMLLFMVSSLNLCSKIPPRRHVRRGGVENRGGCGHGCGAT